MLDNKLSPSTFLFLNVTLHLWHTPFVLHNSHPEQEHLDLLPISLRRRMKDERTERGVQRHFIIYTIFFIVNTWRWRVNHTWLKIAGKDSQYRNQFTQQSCHLREFNERRGERLQVPTARLVVCPQETTSLMCIPVSVQATLAPTWDTEHAQRGWQWNPASDSRQRRNSRKDHIPFIRGWPKSDPHQKPPETQLHAHL